MWPLLGLPRPFFWHNRQGKLSEEPVLSVPPKD